MQALGKTLGLVLLLCGLNTAQAAEVSLAWDAPGDDSVHGYRLYIGSSSGNYTAQFSLGNVTRHTLTGLAAGSRYYLNLKALGSGEEFASGFAGEIIKDVPALVAPAPPVAPPPDPPHARFDASLASGNAPLVVTFSDSSTGEIDEHHWDFGNGVTSTAKVASLTYSEPGTYTVTLAVSGPSGNDTITMPGYVRVEPPIVVATPVQSPDPEHAPAPASELEPDQISTNATVPLDIVEIPIDEQWQYVELTREFLDPVVVAGPASDGIPGTVRIRAIGQQGFEIKLQPWDYLEGAQTSAIVSVLIAERGRHQLPEGGEFEAGRKQTAANQTYRRTRFASEFATSPVVIATITSEAELDAVHSQIRRVTSKGFSFRLQEQEDNPRFHASETIDYIAWLPSTGQFDRWQYEVAITPRAVNHQFYPIWFAEPVAGEAQFFAAAQSGNSRDPASIVTQYSDYQGIEIRLAEEQSRDSETHHNRQIIGYLMFSAIP